MKRPNMFLPLYPEQVAYYVLPWLSCYQDASHTALSTRYIPVSFTLSSSWTSAPISFSPQRKIANFSFPNSPQVRDMFLWTSRSRQESVALFPGNEEQENNARTSQSGYLGYRQVVNNAGGGGVYKHSGVQPTRWPCRGGCVMGPPHRSNKNNTFRARERARHSF